LKTVSIKILLNAFFLYIIITVSNPFVKTTFLSLNSLGFELNAILHNPLLLVHPPLMYFGYAGTLIGFTYMISLILQHNLYLQKLLKMWIILNWTCLTFGIILGSWWAYQELGWGGIWFWDPVENLSLMAWLINTTLLHLLSKYNKKHIVKTWLIILLNVAFLISYISIFLIRSGLLLTAHNFVTNIKINLYLLSCLVILMSFILFLYLAKAVQGIIQTYFVIYNIENFIFLNNLLFVMMFMILSLNLVSELGAKSSQSIIFENSFFKDILSSISLVILLLFIGNILLVLNQLIKFNKINFLLFLSANCLFFSYNLLNSQFNKISFLMLLFIYFAGMLVFIYVLVKKTNKIIPHLSILAFFSFLTISNFFEYDNTDMLRVGEKFNILELELEYNYMLRDISILKNKIYYIIYSNILFFQTDHNFSVFFPEKHYYFLQNLTISKPAIFSNYAGDFYTILNNGNFWLGYSIKVIFKPVLTLLWSSIIVVLLTVLAFA
jgi:cytochrome c-type biogenesis protein CcmF